MSRSGTTRRAGRCCRSAARWRRRPPAGESAAGTCRSRTTPACASRWWWRRDEQSSGGGGMRTAHEVAAVRAAEQALMATLPPGTLMQRAAAGLAAVCAGVLGRVYGTRVAVLAGSGDNGGDALYAGARLARRGAAVTAITAGPKAHQGGTAELRAAGGRVTPDLAAAPDLIGCADLIVDGLLGIGGRGGLRDPFAGLAAAADRARRDGHGTVVAVDLPSGIDADTGAVDGPAVRADVTVTFGAIKPGLLVDPGAGHAGTRS